MLRCRFHHTRPATIKAAVLSSVEFFKLDTLRCRMKISVGLNLRLQAYRNRNEWLTGTARCHARHHLAGLDVSVRRHVQPQQGLSRPFRFLRSRPCEDANIMPCAKSNRQTRANVMMVARATPKMPPASSPTPRCHLYPLDVCLVSEPDADINLAVSRRSRGCLLHKCRKAPFKRILRFRIRSRANWPSQDMFRHGFAKRYAVELARARDTCTALRCYPANSSYVNLIREICRLPVVFLRRLQPARRSLYPSFRTSVKNVQIVSDIGFA